MADGVTAFPVPAAGASLLSVPLQHIKSSDQQSLAWDSEGKSHRLLLKGHWKVYEKTKPNICRLESTTVGSALPQEIFLQGIYRSTIKDEELLTHKYRLLWAKALGSRPLPFHIIKPSLPCNSLLTRTRPDRGHRHFPKSLSPFGSYLDMCVDISRGWAGDTRYGNSASFQE